MKITIELECEVDGEYNEAAHAELLHEAVLVFLPASLHVEEDICRIIVRGAEVKISEKVTEALHVKPH